MISSSNKNLEMRLIFPPLPVQYRPAQNKLLYFLVLLTFILSIVMGCFLGSLLAFNRYIYDYVDLMKEEQSLPSRILDANGNLITEVSEGSRALLAQNELSRNLIYAILAREDNTFFEHNGFSFDGTLRALIYIILNKLWGTPTAGGGSTLSQQLAGNLKTNRSEITYRRKLIELWWAFILEQHYSKLEILVSYLNTVYFGDRNYGIEAASQFFFGQPAQKNSIAEAALAMIQLARPNGDLSPLQHPERAKLRQKAVLDKIVELGFMSKEQVEQASRTYWDSFDLTQVSRYEPKRVDKAPYFSDYVQRFLEKKLYGTDNLLQAGYTIYTTLDLDKQREAEQIVSEELKKIDQVYNRGNLDLINILEQKEIPELRRLMMLWGLNHVNLFEGRSKRQAQKTLKDELAPTLEALLLGTGMLQFQPLLKMSASYLDRFRAKNIPEMALVTIDNRNGEILLMVGGRDYNMNESRLFNRAVDAQVLPGSAFKPLYYAAAIRDKVLTPASMLSDAPYRFVNPDGTAYIPENYYAQRYQRKISMRRALALSLNIPAIHVLEAVGFDSAIETATKLLGISDPQQINQNFPHVYPIALGVSPAAPIQLARAYSTFANRGIPLEPNAVRYIQDRNGQTIFNFIKERNPRQESRRILSEQEAFIMTDMLVSVVRFGTVYGPKTRYENEFETKFEYPLAAKSGTTQNWSDGWVIGYTPHYTTVVWVGFDKPGNSLGEQLYGSRAAGPTFMRINELVHRGVPNDKIFEVPEEGLYQIAVDRRNGYRWTQECDPDDRYVEYFLPGTVPQKQCNETEQGSVFNRGSSKIGNNLLGHPKRNSERDPDGGETFTLENFSFLSDGPEEPAQSESPSSPSGNLVSPFAESEQRLDELIESGLD